MVDLGPLFSVHQSMCVRCQKLSSTTQSDGDREQKAVLAAPCHMNLAGDLFTLYDHTTARIKMEWKQQQEADQQQEAPYAENYDWLFEDLDSIICEDLASYASPSSGSCPVNVTPDCCPVSPPAAKQTEDGHRQVRPNGSARFRPETSARNSLPRPQSVSGSLATCRLDEASAGSVRGEEDLLSQNSASSSRKRKFEQLADQCCVEVRPTKKIRYCSYPVESRYSHSTSFQRFIKSLTTSVSKLSDKLLNSRRNSRVKSADKTAQYVGRENLSQKKKFHVRKSASDSAVFKMMRRLRGGRDI